MIPHVRSTVDCPHDWSNTTYKPIGLYSIEVCSEMFSIRHGSCACVCLLKPISSSERNLSWMQVNMTTINTGIGYNLKHTGAKASNLP